MALWSNPDLFGHIQSIKRYLDELVDHVKGEIGHGKMLLETCAALLKKLAPKANTMHTMNMNTSDVKPEMLDGLRFVRDELISLPPLLKKFVANFTPHHHSQWDVTLESVYRHVLQICNSAIGIAQDQLPVDDEMYHFGWFR